VKQAQNSFTAKIWGDSVFSFNFSVFSCICAASRRCACKMKLF